MTRFSKLLAALFVLMALAAPAKADSSALAEKFKGDARAPVVIDEYISLTCPHCAHFYLETLPELEKRYVANGKVKIVMHDYPLDGLSLKAAALARCMPNDMYFPFIQVLYENQEKWAIAPQPDKMLVQYARLGGLDEQTANACLTDTKMQNAIVEGRAAATATYDISSTPTFVFNKGVEKIAGSSDINGFAVIIDRMLASTKK